MSLTNYTSLETVLIDWCDKHIAVNQKYSEVKKIKKLKGGVLKYYDSTGGSAAFSDYGIYLMPNKSYKVTYNNCYQGSGDSLVKDCKDIKEALMFVILHRRDWNLTQTRSCQMILNNNNIGYQGKRDEFVMLHRTKIINMNPDDPFDYDVEVTPRHEKDFLI